VRPEREKILKRILDILDLAMVRKSTAKKRGWEDNVLAQGKRKTPGEFQGGL